MNGLTRLLNLFAITEKKLFVLAGDIDTYVYLLFLRNTTVLIFILAVLNCGVLIPLYATGETASLCSNNEKNVNSTIYLT
jgi:Late exocytosis, associated with Golgi transport